MARSPLTAVKTTPRPGNANLNAQRQPTNPYANNNSRPEPNPYANRPAVLVNLVDLDFTLDETCVRLRELQAYAAADVPGEAGRGGGR